MFVVLLYNINNQTVHIFENNMCNTAIHVNTIHVNQNQILYPQL